MNTSLTAYVLQGQGQETVTVDFEKAKHHPFGKSVDVKLQNHVGINRDQLVGEEAEDCLHDYFGQHRTSGRQESSRLPLFGIFGHD